MDKIAALYTPAFDLLQVSETPPWSTFDIDINGNDRPNSTSATARSRLRDGEDRFKLLELSLRNAVSMVIIFCLIVSSFHGCFAFSTCK